jgi:hypothetical protein
MLRTYKPKMLGLVGLMAAVAMMVAAFGATAARAAEGPVWIHGAGRVVLLAGQNLTIDSESEGEVTLLSSIVNILCKSLQNKGELFGGNPGTDLEELEFLECHVEGKTVAECAATSSGAAKGVILTNVLTALAYPLGGQAGNEALDAVFPDGSNETFVTFTLAGTNCGLLAGNVTVLAIGLPLIELVKNEAFEAQCGETGQLGKLEGGVFLTVAPGVVEEDPVLNFPGPESAELWSTFNLGALKFEAITCKLEVDAALKVTGVEDALVLAEVLNAEGLKESLGWEH